jgi:hypothetical protein
MQNIPQNDWQLSSSYQADYQTTPMQPPLRRQLPARRIFALAGLIALIITVLLFAATLEIAHFSTTNYNAGWHVTHTFIASTNVITDPITIRSGQWEFLWNCQLQNSHQASAFVVTLHDPNTSNPLDIPIDTDCQTEARGSTYDYQIGTFYLEIDSVNANWMLQIQEQ